MSEQDKKEDCKRNSKGDKVRNICIMAHVDHGKTTLADSLIATNGIISEKQAGAIKYMDSRPDEIERGITMKSSCITLAFPHLNQSYLINLIDSPGHVDFSSEVSTAVRLCDGYILVVDVVEGVCAQTKAVMRQAWVAGVKPVLVLNKLDRLVLEQGMTPLDAYYHLENVLQQTNAYMGELYNTDVLGRTNMKDKKSSDSSNKHQSANVSVSPSKLGKSGADVVNRHISEWGIEDVDDSELYFNPTAGNVVFASAIDGWGFGVFHFAEQFASKLGMSYEALSKTLWGDYYISSKGGTKRIMKGARDKRKNPLFVTLILDNLYELYRKVRPSTADVDEVKRIAATLGVSVPQRLCESSTETKARFTHICSNWLPLSTAVLGMVVLQLPPPTQLSAERARKLLTTATHDFEALPASSRALVQHLQRCSNEDTAPLVVYISKMFGVCRKKLRAAEKKLEETKARANGSYKPPVRHDPHIIDAAGGSLHEEEVADAAEEEEVEELLGFARVFSGSLKAGQEVYVLGPKHNPATALSLEAADGGPLTRAALLDRCPYITSCKVGSLYLLLGREVQCLASAGAGLLLGVGGLTDHVVKSASISSTPACPPFTHVLDASSAVGGPGMGAGGDPSGPILRVQVLPKNPRCLGRLRDGLKLLNQADPCVQVWLEGSGEYMVGAAGEVHLQRCIRDLEERYARTPVTASDPIVPFRETVVPPPTVDQTNEVMDGDNAPQQPSDAGISHSGVLGSLRMRVLPLPAAVTQLLYRHCHLLTLLAAHSNNLTQDSCSLLPLATGVDAANSLINTVNPQMDLANSESETSNNEIETSNTEIETSNTEIETSNKEIETSNKEIETSNTEIDKPNTTEIDKSNSTTDFNTSDNVSDSFSNITVNGSTQRLKANGEPNSTLSDNPNSTLSDYPNSTLSDNPNSMLSDNPNSSADGQYFPVKNISKPADNIAAHYLLTQSVPVADTLSSENQEALSALHQELTEAFNAAGPEWEGAADQIWSLGPHFCGPNVLLNRSPLYQRPSIWESLAQLPEGPVTAMDHGLVTAFQLTAACGSLCEEPLMGVCFLVEDWQPAHRQGAPLLPGKALAAAKELLLSALEEQPRRMLVATYSCVVTVTQDVVGRVYSVIGRRHGRILHGDVTEGSMSWNITALLPIVESIDFANELRKATSGEAQPQLVFSHWDLLDQDPYWDPCTAEELKHFGEKADTDNLARQYMNRVRRRKGIKEYGKKLVEFGEKQRTLGKNK